MGFAGMLEFPAVTGATLEVPAGTSIRINYASAKGGAAPYMRFQLRIGDQTCDLLPENLSPLYINGPATLSSVPAVLTPTAGIPYKYTSSGGGTTPDTYPILYDANGTGDYSTTLFSYDSRYQAYLDWLARGNTPLPAGTYTGTEIGSSGVLIKYIRYSNQPYRSLFCSNTSTQTINIPAGKKLVIPSLAGQGIYRIGWASSGGDAGSDFYLGSTSSDMFLSSLSITIKGGYPVNLPGCDIDGPEVVTIKYNKQQQIILGGAGLPPLPLVR
jgi:hypothetical protein